MNKLSIRQQISIVKDIYISKLHQKNILDLVDNALGINNVAPSNNKKNHINSYLKSILQNKVMRFLSHDANNDNLMHVIDYLNGKPFPIVDIPTIRIYGDNDQFQDYKITEILDIIAYHQYSSFFNKNTLTTTAERLIKHSLNMLLNKNINITMPDIKLTKIRSSIYKDLINNYINEEIRVKLLNIIPKRILLQKYF